ncbi:C80 family cysteine peptidase, partial [Burkholderia ambifaria]|uniref:C80 family cysteine peptidase n=1 Tax=Burkholderia ambifaria TaxID=152480 RepID=UPI001FC832C7
ARRGADRYTQRVIVQQGDDAVTVQAAKNLANKHPENTTLVKAGPDGQLAGLDDIPATGGQVKVQVVGHGDVVGGTLGGADAPALARQLGQVRARLGDDAAVGKVALVGCQTACATEAGQPSLKQRVRTDLAQQGIEVGEVKGYDSNIKIDLEGRKQAAGTNDINQLGPRNGGIVRKIKSLFGRQNKVAPTDAQLDEAIARDPELKEYVVAMRQDGRRLKRDEVEALVRATETAREVKEKLSYGRGNVIEDINRTNFNSSRAMILSRQLDSVKNWPREMAPELAKIDPRVRAAAASMLARGGNCGEHAQCAFILHANRIRPGENVSLVSGDQFDHAWVEVTRKNKETIVIDPWQDGPAAFKRDFQFRDARTVQSGPSMSYENHIGYVNQINRLHGLIAPKQKELSFFINRTMEAKINIESPQGLYGSSSVVDWGRFSRHMTNHGATQGNQRVGR